MAQYHLQTWTFWSHLLVCFFVIVLFCSLVSFYLGPMVPQTLIFTSRGSSARGNNQQLTWIRSQNCTMNSSIQTAFIPNKIQTPFNSTAELTACWEVSTSTCTYETLWWDWVTPPSWFHHWVTRMMVLVQCGGGTAASWSMASRHLTSWSSVLLSEAAALFLLVLLFFSLCLLHTPHNNKIRCSILGLRNPLTELNVKAL